MSQQQIITTPANSGKGDSPKSAFDKINSNFTEIYAASGFTPYLQTAAEVSVGVMPVNTTIPSHLTGAVLPERYGAVGNGNPADLVNAALDTAAINSAVLVAAATGVAILLSRQYIAAPTIASTQEGMGITVLALMKSNVHVYGERGASITMANGQSTDAAPKNLAFFHTNQVLSNVTFRGIIFDMNGANNPISPGRLNNVVTTGASGTGVNATITFAAQPFAAPVGSLLVVTGVTPLGYNTPPGGANIISSTTTSVTYANTTTGAQTIAGQVNGGYNSNFNQAAIQASGTPSGLAAHIDDVIIESCVFKNNPGSSNIVCGQSNNTGAAITFTGALSAGAVSATMTVVWPNATGVYLVNFSDGEVRAANFTNGIAGITWGQPLLGSATTAATYTQAMGKRWTVRKNLFLNNGGDHLDHTSLFGYCEELNIDGNWFWNDLAPHTVGLTGGSSAFEIHGSRSFATNNVIYNYRNGGYVAANTSSVVQDTTVADNHLYTTDYGFIIFRLVSMFEIDGIDIHDNHSYMDNYQYIGQNNFRAFVVFQGQYTQQQGRVNNVKIHDNEGICTGTSLISYVVRWETVTTVGSQVCSNLSVTNNQMIGYNTGVFLLTNAANPQGYTEISGNSWINFAPDALANPAIGINVNPTGGISTLVIDQNKFIDERGGSATFTTGIFMSAGTITDFFFGQQTFKGVVGFFFNNSATFTNIRSSFTQSGSQANVADGGTITYTNGFTGIIARSVAINPSVAGTIGTVTSITTPTFTVALKNWTGGVLTAAANQTVYYTANY